MLNLNKLPAVVGVAIAVALSLAFYAGALDASTAASGLLMANAGAVVEVKQLEAAMKDAFRAMSDSVTEVKERMRDVEQKLAHRPGGGAGTCHGGDPISELTELVQNSGPLGVFKNGQSPKVEIRVPRDLFAHAMMAAAITGDNTATTGDTGTLVRPDRRPGIVAPVQRRFTIRDLFGRVPTSSNMVEFTKETAFTNNAAIQGVDTSPTGQYEGQPKAESGFTFSLDQVKVPTIAHWIPASRQVLDDAPMLRQYIDSRLLYGLKLKEEDEFLNGDGTGGHVDGLINQATEFVHGSSSLTKLDVLAKAAMQLMLSDHEPTGFILNPLDWFDILLTKDDEGRYLIGNPAQMAEPRLWGLPVVATNTMTSGNFVALDAPRAGFVADREDAIVRVSESHEGFFVRNMVAILCEERSTIVVERPAAIVYGAINHNA